MDDLLEEFITEACENLERLDNDLVVLEKDPNDVQLLGNIFRTIHTIKGACGFIGLARLEKVAHSGENVLGKFRDGEMKVNPEAITLILACVDAIKFILQHLKETGEEPEGNDSALIQQLQDLIALNDGSAGEGESAAEVLTEEFHEETAVENAGEDKELEEPTPTIMEEAEVAVVSEEIEALSPPVDLDEEDAIIESETPLEAPKVPVAAAQGPAPHEAQKSPEKDLSPQSIRVSVSLLENLITTVGELVLTRNQLLQLVRQSESSTFEVPLQRLNQVTSELQESVMKTRMQPIGNAWSQMPRLVRDLAKDLNKKIELEMLGADTEIDRQVIELIKDPLTHMLRNSADHGLETPEERLKSGKSPTGNIRLNAYQAGGHIVIEISDNGRGLNLEKIREKAIQNRLASAEEVLNKSDAQICQYIFHAGLSTADKVTNVSGRGVGMDVVKTNIEKIGGNIEVKSVTGRGTVFTITIPLTLAIVAALIVGVEDQRYAIPQVSILELVRIAADSELAIEYINNNPVLRLRNRLLQLVFLNELFGLEKKEIDTTTAGNEDQYVLIVQVGSYYFGIVVSEVFDTQEIVVKPVSPLLQGINVYAGNTILGDGSVVMILDPKGIILRKGEIDLTDRGAEDLNDRKTFAEDMTSLLLFKAGDDSPKAVPLELVVRLEEFDLKDIEHSHGQSIVQYRDQLMPLIPLDQYGGMPTEGTISALVFSNGEHFAGLIVDQIIDIVEERVELKMQSSSDDVYGTAVISGHATDVMDVDYYIRRLFPKWVGASNRKTKGAKQSVLLLGDGVFFRNILGTLLRMEGYETQSADNLSKALRLIEQGQPFDVVIQDYDSTVSFESDDTGSLKRFLESNPLLLLTEDGNLPHGAQLYGEGMCCGKEDRGMILRAIAELIEHSHREAA